MKYSTFVCSVAISALTGGLLAAEVYSDTPIANLRVRGLAGERLDAMLANNLCKTDYDYLAFPFTRKTETGSWEVIQPGIWQNEFWGKLMHAAVPLARYPGAGDLEARLEKSVKTILSHQLADGYIGNYRPEFRGEVCDVWGAKYTLMGLIHWYDLTSDKASLEASKRLVDWLISRFGPEKMSLGATGPFCGLMNCSVLEPVMWLYQRTGEKRYLDFAKWIVTELDVNKKGPELIPLALKGVPVRDRHPDTHGHKAYEMMSCCQGLLDYYLQTGDKRCFDAVLRSAENIIADEIDIAGGGTQYERFCGSRARQARDYAVGSETCVLTTWMRLCQKLSSVTGETRWADELEKTFFNAYLGSLSRSGDIFDSYSCLAGERECRHPLHCRMQINCCAANGPRGFVAYLGNAVTTGKEVVNVNQYLFGIAKIPCPGSKGNTLILDSFTEYPRKMRYALTIGLDKPATFTLRFRAPSWSAKTAFRFSSGEQSSVTNAGYVAFTKEWKDGDQVEVLFEDKVKEHIVDSHVAYTYGPLALARDVRFADGDLSERVRRGDVTFESISAPDASMYAAFGAFMKMGVHDNPPRPISFCDYASAGSTRDGKSFYRVWLPIAE